MKKVFALLLVLIICFGAVACGSMPNPNGDIDDTTTGGNNNNHQIDKSKTQLRVKNYDGGYGTDWLNEVKKRFEAEYADTQFEEGKKGVEIIIDAEKSSDYYGSGLYNSMGMTTNEVFFSEHVFYSDYVASGYALDITDIVTGQNSDGKTVESKMTDEQKAFLNLEGKYYALPHYAGFAGINYDVDLFNTKSLYFAKNGAPSEENYTGTVTYTNLAGARSAGPDGEYGTSDDGLPATYDEFFALCGYMKTKKGVTPILWNGQYKDTYMKWILAALGADYEGAEQLMLNFTFDGTATGLATVEGDRIVLDAEDTVITPENGYEVYRQAGRYYALSFLERIIDGGYADTSSFDDGTSHTSAQTNYLRSSYKNEPVAMLFEGIWWVNEAAETFTRMARSYGDEYSMANRNFAFMPLPKVDDSHIGEGSTIIDTHFSYAFIRASIDPNKIELAKLFLQFCYTDTSLVEFTRISGLPKAVRYDIPATGFEWNSSYSKSVWEMYHSSSVVFPASQSRIYLSSQASFEYNSTFVTGTENSAITAFQSGKSAASFFSGIIDLKNRSYWENSFGKFFD